MLFVVRKDRRRRTLNISGGLDLFHPGDQGSALPDLSEGSSDRPAEAAL